MPLKHAELWKAIDDLAKRHGFSVSGLARKAGLSATVFNPSKRATSARKRWPSTESIARILQVTETSLEEFIALLSPGTRQRTALPLIGYLEAGRKDAFNEDGFPAGDWDEIAFPDLPDPHAFALEIAGKGMEPVYREGDRIVASPSSKPRRGDRVIARTTKGEVLVRQLGQETAQKIELISLNPAFPPVMMPRRDIEWMYRIVWVSQ